MVVEVSFIHPNKGAKCIQINNAPSVEDVIKKLNDMGCTVLSAEEVTI